MSEWYWCALAISGWGVVLIIIALAIAIPRIEKRRN